MKKAKQEQAEFEGRSTEEETDVSMETDRKQDVARENENVTQNVPEIKVTCEDEGMCDKCKITTVFWSLSALKR